MGGQSVQLYRFDLFVELPLYRLVYEISMSLSGMLSNLLQAI